jgi:hypothetical protein
MAEHTVEDLLEWNDEEYDERIHIKMGMKRVDGGKDPLPYPRGGGMPTYNRLCPGKDADWAGKQTTTGKDLWGIEDHAGNWKGFASEHKVHAVLPHLHNRGTLLILDADPGPGMAWTSKEHVLSWLKEHEQFEWVLDCPYTETKKGWHFYFFCDTLPPLFPAVQKGMFAGLGDAAELFGGNNFVPGGGTGQVNPWVWEAKKRPLFNWHLHNRGTRLILDADPEPGRQRRARLTGLEWVVGVGLERLVGLEARI